MTACERPPTLDDVKGNFYKNISSFNELEKLACALGQEKQEFGPDRNSYSYSQEKVPNDQKIEGIDLILNKIGAYAVNYEKTTSGNCSLVVGYFVRGFAGSGVVYNYSFQIDSPTILENTNQSLSDDVENKSVVFDMPLSDGWYLSYISN
jgi:hypothetical protein